MAMNGAGKPGPLFRQRERWFYWLIAPWLIGFMLFQGGPILGALLLAFFERPLSQSPQFVGAFHFSVLLRDSVLWRALWNTFYYAAGSAPIGIVLSLGLALLLNRRRRGVVIFRTFFFLPVVTSGVALALLWAWIFNPRYGLLNTLLALTGIHGPAWLHDERWAMPALILMTVWGVGVNMMIYLAALQEIPADLMDAAGLDGAGRWQRLRHLIWPMISPVTFYLLVVNLIASFQVFTPTYVLTRGGPNNATLTLPLYIYFNAFTWAKPGYGAALALLLFATVLAITAIQFRLARRWVFYRGGS